VRDKVSHPYKTTGKIIVLYILILNYYRELNSESNDTDQSMTECKYIDNIGLTLQCCGIFNLSNAPSSTDWFRLVS
jgi:hypothetical protein